MTPLMPVIFIMSAIVSGIALCLLTYIVTMEIRKLISKRKRASHVRYQSQEELKSVETSVMQMTAKYLLAFMVAAISLELLDIIFRGYTAVKSWDILRSVIYERDFADIFIFQYGIGNALPLILFLIPGLTIRRAIIASALVLFGVFMMRWNVVIGGQAFSLTFAGYMHYHMPIIPHDWETFKEGAAGATHPLYHALCAVLGHQLYLPRLRTGGSALIQQERSLPEEQLPGGDAQILILCCILFEGILQSHHILVDEHRSQI